MACIRYPLPLTLHPDRVSWLWTDKHEWKHYLSSHYLLQYRPVAPYAWVGFLWVMVYIRCVNKLVNFTWRVPVIIPHPFMVYPSHKYNTTYMISKDDMIYFRIVCWDHLQRITFCFTKEDGNENSKSIPKCVWWKPRLEAFRIESQHKTVLLRETARGVPPAV